MAMSDGWNRDLEKRMEDMSKKMDRKFAKFGMEPRKPTPPKRPTPPKSRYENSGFFSNKSSNTEGSVIVDGQKIKIENGQNVIVQGSVIELTIQNADKVKVEGQVKTLKNQNSDIECNNIQGDVSNQNGDIKCNSVTSGKVTAHNGDVKIKHKVEAVPDVVKVEGSFVPDFYKATVKAHLLNGGIISAYRHSEEGELVKVITENTALNWDEFFYMITADKPKTKRNTSGKCYIKD